MMDQKTKQTGSALLYTIVLIGALLIVGELAFSYITFSLKSRAESYRSQVNYWLAWGGAEAALSQINNFAATGTSTAFRRWPQGENNLIESPQFVTLQARENDAYKPMAVGGADFYSSFSASYFTVAPSPQYQNHQVPVSMTRDQSKIFDLSKFKGSMRVNFYPYQNSTSPVENNLVWIRAEKNSADAGHEVSEAIVKINPPNPDGDLTMILKGTTDPNLNSQNIAKYIQPQTCTGIGRDPNRGVGFMSIKCTFTISPPPNIYRFFKVKVFQSDADLNFALTNNSQLGMPDTIIHAVGQMKANDENKKELFIKFPNQLKSISDVLDYSIYQAEF